MNTPGEDNSGGENSDNISDSDKENSVDNNITNEDKNNSQNNSSKLPTTGKESILGYISVAAIAIGAVLYKKKK